MTKTEYHNGKTSPFLGASTLAALIDIVEGSNVAESVKSELRSAIRSVDKLIGHGVLDLPADLKLIMKRLSVHSPATAGMSPGGFATTKSRIRRAFRIARGKLTGEIGKPRPKGEWGTFRDGLPTKPLRALSRLIYFADSQGWLPSQLGDEHINRFGYHLREVAGIDDWEGVIRATIKWWNKLRDMPQYSCLQKLTPPVLKRIPYWIPEGKWQPSLREHKDAFLRHLEGSGSFLGTPHKKLDPSTIEQYKYHIILSVSALSATGTPLALLNSLAELVIPDRVDRILMFLLERAGGKVTSQMAMVADRAVRIAQWCGLSESTCMQLEEMRFQVRAREARKRGLTAKNISLLKRLAEDQRFADAVVLLPWYLAAKAEKLASGRQSKTSTSAPAVMLTAVAIALLLTCNMRRQNLVNLRLDASIRKIGAASNQHWVVELESEEVKNEEPLYFQLPQTTADLLEEYLKNWRPRFSGSAGHWLFPASGNTHIDPRKLAWLVTRYSQRVCGERITPHQFRHIGATIYIQDNPDGIFSVSQHLGHRDVNTTKRYYAKPAQREATRRYQSTVVLRQSEAARRLKLRKPWKSLDTEQEDSF